MPSTKESSELRRVWHIVHNCECRHASTWREAVDELDALVAERDALRKALERIATRDTKAKDVVGRAWDYEQIAAAALERPE
jgi:hypothetical protein